MAEPTRRTLLRVAAAAGVATATGCTATADLLGLRPTVKVAVSWSGRELRAFRDVLDAVVPDDYAVEVIPLGDDIATAFGPRAPRRPDVVMLPQPGQVRSVDTLEPLPDDLAWPYAAVWRDMVQSDGVRYGLPFKIAHKSAVWYRKSVLGQDPPTTWSGWLELNAELVRKGVPPLALAAGDGWVLTDVFENALLGLSPAAYRRLAVADPPRPSREPAVRDALRLTGALWAMPGALAGGVDRSLTQQFPDAVVEVFGYRRAAMVLAPDFAEPIIAEFGADRSDVGVFTVPAVVAGQPAPVVIGGDVAVLPAPAGDQARDLIRRLAGRDAADRWIRAGGFLAANLQTPADGYSPELAELSGQLTGGGTAFDLSDRLGVLGGARGLQLVLHRFLTRVGGRGAGAVDPAVAVALDELRELEE
jgi:alpha-glucoside transport system substrate-binding protein